MCLAHSLVNKCLLQLTCVYLLLTEYCDKPSLGMNVHLIPHQYTSVQAFKACRQILGMICRKRRAYTKDDAACTEKGIR
jgi:hypothetical protein